MNINSKPQAINLRQPIDDESITANLIANNRQNGHSNISKSLLLLATDAKDEVKKMLRENRNRRDEAALRLPPLPCGCRDPLRCRCNRNQGKR